jgi:hypothetical protein
MKTEGTRFHLRGADNLPKVDVHPRIAIHQMPVVRFSILQLHELRSQNIRRLEQTGTQTKNRTTELPTEGVARRRDLTMGCPWAVLRSERGSCKRAKTLNQARFGDRRGKVGDGERRTIFARDPGIKYAGSKERDGAGRSPAPRRKAAVARRDTGRKTLAYSG